MAELARGTVDDRPWGLTFAALGLRGLTGQLTLAEGGKRYQVAFVEGAVVGAASPSPNDAAVRVALTANLVSSGQVSEIVRQMGGAPQRDELEIIAEIAKLSADKVQRLRRRLVAQRAARTFAIEHGDFVIEDHATVPIVAGSELDVRSVVYLGAKTNLSETRLATELSQLGAWFKLKQEALADLAQYGFTEAERPVLQRLQRGANLSDLVGDPELDARVTRTIIYALVSCGAVEVSAESRSMEPPRPRTITNETTKLRRDIAPPPPRPDPSLDAPTHATPAAGRLPTSNPAPAARPATIAPATRAKKSSEATADTEKLIAELVPLLDRGADHFALLGVPFEATPDAVRASYFNLARKLHPDRLSSLGIADPTKSAQRLFAQINAAFAVLSDPARREEYLEVQKRGGEKAVREEDSKAEELAMRVLRAEEAFKAGEIALKRDQIQQALAAFTEACELQPQEAEYQALLAWAKFAAAPDKNAAAGATRTALQKAADSATKSPAARFYLGRMERMLGREKEALAHFQQVLMIKANHQEAAAEVRLLEQRLKGRR